MQGAQHRQVLEMFCRLHLLMYRVNNNNVHTKLRINNDSGEKSSLEECRKLVLWVEVYQSDTTRAVCSVSVWYGTDCMQSISLIRHGLYAVYQSDTARAVCSVSVWYGTDCMQCISLIRHGLCSVSVWYGRTVCSVSVWYGTDCMQCISLPEAYKMLKTLHINVNVVFNHPELNRMSVHVLIPVYHKCL